MFPIKPFFPPTQVTEDVTVQQHRSSSGWKGDRYTKQRQRENGNKRNNQERDEGRERETQKENLNAPH